MNWKALCQICKQYTRLVMTCNLHIFFCSLQKLMKSIEREKKKQRIRLINIDALSICLEFIRIPIGHCCFFLFGKKKKRPNHHPTTWRKKWLKECPKFELIIVECRLRADKIKIKRNNTKAHIFKHVCNLQRMLFRFSEFFLFGVILLTK